MAGRLFTIPFATSGDRTSIPDATQPSGAVSFTDGFTPDYELPNTDPNYKPVPRDESNALYHDITEALGIVQKQGFADWFDPAVSLFNYQIAARVRHLDQVWRSAVANNTSTPGTNTDWVLEGAIPDASETVKGIVELATAAETIAGALATLAVHPAGLLAALTAFLPKRTFATNDFVRIPDVPGGLIIQFGSASPAGVGSGTITYPTVFTNGVRFCGVLDLAVIGAAIAYVGTNPNNTNFTWQQGPTANIDAFNWLAIGF